MARIAPSGIIQSTVWLRPSGPYIGSHRPGGERVVEFPTARLDVGALIRDVEEVRVRILGPFAASNGLICPSKFMSAVESISRTPTL
jgi:hypothetical protein